MQQPIIKPIRGYLRSWCRKTKKIFKKLENAKFLKTAQIRDIKILKRIPIHPGAMQ